MGSVCSAPRPILHLSCVEIWSVVFVLYCSHSNTQMDKKVKTLAEMVIEVQLL